MRNKRVKLVAWLAIPVLIFMAMVPVARRQRERANTRALLSELQTPEPRFEVVDLLLRAGANANVRDPDGVTALHYAAGSAPKCLRVLLDHHANINALDERGRTPLIWAIIGGQTQSVRLLLKRGASANRQAMLQTAPGREALNTAQRMIHYYHYKAAQLAQMLKAAGAKE